VTVFGKDDGAGSQALAGMSALALAKQYGLTYAHTPFRTVQHAEGPPEMWAAAWERIFNFGKGELQVSDCTLPRVEIEEFIADPRWWSAPCLLCARYFTVILDRMPDTYAAAVPDLRTKYDSGNARQPPSDIIEVCVHARRGFDVRPDNPETAHRFVSNEPIANAVSKTQLVLNQLGLEARVRLFSQGQERDFAVPRDLGVELCLNTPGIETFHELVRADILIMSKSSYSYAAAILNEGIKLYDRFARSPMSDWIVRNSDGGFDVEELRRKLFARARDSSRQHGHVTAAG